MPKPLYITSVCFLLLILASCGAPYETFIDADLYTNEVLREGLLNIEKHQRDSQNFANLGINRYSNLLNIILFVNAVLAGAAGAFAGTKLWNKMAKPRLVLLLIFAIGVSASSATGLFVKSESDRFFEENRHKFTALSLEMDDAITDFYLEFRRADYNDASMELPPTRADFLELLAGTLRRLGDLRKEYNDNYRLNTNL